MSLEQAVQDNTAAIRDLIESVREAIGSRTISNLLREMVVETHPDPRIRAGMTTRVEAPPVIATIPEVAPEIVKPAEITKEMVNAQLKAAMQTKGGPALRVLFAEFGVSNFKDITESQYSPIYAAATKLLEG